MSQQVLDLDDETRVIYDGTTDAGRLKVAELRHQGLVLTFEPGVCFAEKGADGAWVLFVESPQIRSKLPPSVLQFF